MLRMIAMVVMWLLHVVHVLHIIHVLQYHRNVGYYCGCVAIMGRISGHRTVIHIIMIVGYINTYTHKMHASF